MTQVIFSLTEPGVLVLAILCAVITGYLVTLRDKTRDLPYLLGAFSCWTAYFVLLVIAEAKYPTTQWQRVAEFTSGLAGLALLVGFAYRFLGNPYPREARVATVAAALAVVACAVTLSLQLAWKQRVLWSVGSGTSSLLFVWAEATFVRRWLTGPRHQDGTPHRGFALVFLLSVAAVSLYFLRDIGLFPASAVPLLSSLLYLGTLMGFALVYVNHSPHPTTFQVKIVGLSLVTMLAVLIAMWTALAPVPAGVPLPSKSALHLKPMTGGTYQVNSVSVPLNQDFGSQIAVADDAEKQIALAWPFRFYGREYRAINVSRSGIVRFDPLPRYDRKGWMDLGPFAAPLNVNPRKTAVYLKQSADKAIVTWQCRSIWMQLVLHRGGAMDFVYDRVDYPRVHGQRGISPGGPFALASQMVTSLADQKEGRVLVEDFELRSRLSAQESLRKSIYTILGSTAFILIVFPLFFRASLVEPLNSLLEGIEQVDEGRTAIQIPVKFNDEIGRLASNFNRMARSLRAAKEELLDYTQSLERKVEYRTAELAQQNAENERLLLNILPASVAERLRRGENTIADACGDTTILFADIVGFTELSSRIPAAELVRLLSSLFSEFDDLADRFGVEKIKTIGDAYMAVAGLPEARPDHAEAALRLALAMMETVQKHVSSTGKPLQLRIGLASGPVIAGVIGTRKFAYDLWGDAVNTASRMQTHAQPGRIQVTEATYRLLRDKYEFDSCGPIDVKGKGRMPTFVVARTVEAEAPAA